MTLRDALETLALRLGRAVVLYDADLGMVDFTADDRSADEARRLNVLARRASTTAQTMIRRSGANQTHGPVRIPAVTGARGRVVHAVRYRDRLLGYVSYIDDAPPGTPVPPEDARSLASAAPEISRALFHRRLDEERDRAYETGLLRRLLSGDPADDPETAAADLLDGGFLAPAPAYTSAVLTTPSDPATLLTTLLSRLATTDRVAWHLDDPHDTGGRGATRPSGPGGRAVLVLGCTGREVTAVPLVARFAQSGDPGAALGVGAARERLADVAGAYREARITSEAANRGAGPGADPGGAGSGGVVATWDGLGAERLLVRLPLDAMGAGDLPAAVRVLLDAGPSGVVLAATVEAYLDHAGDAQATARDLNLHRSTLYYRLGRARDLTGADLGDGRTRLDLHTGLRTARLLGLL